MHPSSGSSHQSGHVETGTGGGKVAPLTIASWYLYLSAAAGDCHWPPCMDRSAVPGAKAPQAGNASMAARACMDAHCNKVLLMSERGAARAGW